MRIWLDVHLPPALIPWLKERFEVEAEAFRSVGWTREADESVFSNLRKEGEVVMTKDSDFVALAEAKGPPPQVIWVTCGNTSNKNLRRILEGTMEDAIELLNRGEPIVEIRDA
jgi:predicted nuclease of predicted toxin-antitoxin system